MAVLQRIRRPLRHRLNCYRQARCNGTIPRPRRGAVFAQNAVVRSSGRPVGKLSSVLLRLRLTVDRIFNRSPTFTSAVN